MAKSVDHVLALLPFEPPFMQAEGMTCDFVGHPAATEDIPGKAQIKSVLAELGLKPTDQIITILPGSRRSEIKRLLPVYMDAIERILKQQPDAKFVLPVARPILNDVNALLSGSTLPIFLLDPTQFNPTVAEHRKRAIYAASQVALATSGTETRWHLCSETPTSYSTQPP